MKFFTIEKFKTKLVFLRQNLFYMIDSQIKKQTEKLKNNVTINIRDYKPVV